MKLLPSAETRDAVLKHPFFLAGLAVVALLGLTAATLVVADSVRGDGSTGNPTVVVSVETGTPAPGDHTAAASGVSGTTKTTTAVRTAPGNRSPILGSLPGNSDVDIDGRTTDAKWMRIIFPPNNNAGLHGWVEATSLNIIGDPASLVVATAEPPVIVALPTSPPANLTAIALTSEALSSVTATATPTPPGGILPDLVVGTPPTISGGKLFVTVINQGDGAMTGDLVVAVFNSDNTRLLGGATLPHFTLAAGRSIDIGTGYAVNADQTLILVVDPNGDIAETDDTNNRITIAVAVSGDGTPSTPDIPATLIAMATMTAEAEAVTPTPDIPATIIALATQTAEAAQ